MVKISFCQSTYKADFNETKECIIRVAPWVDNVIISYDKSLDVAQVKWLKDNSSKYKIVGIEYEWKDDMPAMRNSYIEKAKELGADWIAVSDPDELYSADLAKNLKRLVEKYDKLGYSMLGVNCRDQFSAVNWLDKLDLVKECPMGYNETSFWKSILILKISGDNSDMMYDGIGTEKNVHETVVSSGSLLATNIPRTENVIGDDEKEKVNEYYYVHKKSALKIWRNAARNMFIGGGGDNIGRLNTLWRLPDNIENESTEMSMDVDISLGLRDIMDGLNITDWNSFENFIIKGASKYQKEKEKEIKLTSLVESDKLLKIDNLRNYLGLFQNWLLDALQAGANNYQTETREVAKWYFALHIDELDDLVLKLIENPPKPTENVEIENFIVRTYFQILGRHPDMIGKEGYVRQILSGKISREEFPEILRESDEYKRKFPSEAMKNGDKKEVTDDDEIVASMSPFPSQKEIEKVVIQAYKSVLGREPDQSGLSAYVAHIKAGKMKTQEQLEAILMESPEYEKRKALQKQREESQYDSNNSDKNSNITVSGIPSPFMRFTSSQKTIKNIDDIDSSKFNTIGLCIMGYSEAVPLMIKSIEAIGKEVDEIHVQGDNFTENDIKLFKEAGKKVEKDINIHIIPWKEDFGDYKNKACGVAKTEWVLILDHDEIPTVEMAKKLKEIVLKSDRGNNFDITSFDVLDVQTYVDSEGKEIIKYQNRSKSGKQLLHWNIPSPYFGRLHIWLKSDYYPWKTIHAPVAYQHIKSVDDVLERSARNVFIGGGGDMSEGKNELWTELHGITNKLGIDTWKDFNEYLKKGNVAYEIIENFQKQSEKEWRDEELCDLKRYYLKLNPLESDRFVK